jgi:putative tryptophan/tyrosine transport system substrate-binding protein
MKRREFIASASLVAVWPLAALAQQPERVRRIGVLMNVNADDRDQQANVATFVQILRQLGWVDGGNIQIEIRWAGGDFAAIRRHAEQLVALAPDVLVSTGNAGMGPLLQATRTVPIVFCKCTRRGWLRLRRQPGGARRQRDRSYSIRIQFEREMARTP